MFGYHSILIALGVRFISGLPFGVLADHRDGLGDVADLVAAVCTWNDHVEITFGHLAHRGVQSGHRPGDRHEGEDHRSKQHHDDDRAEPQIDAARLKQFIRRVCPRVSDRFLRNRHAGPQQVRDLIGERNRARFADGVLRFIGIDRLLAGFDELLDQRFEALDVIVNSFIHRKPARSLQRFGQHRSGAGDLFLLTGFSGREELPAFGTDGIHGAIGISQIRLSAAPVRRFACAEQCVQLVEAAVPLGGQRNALAVQIEKLEVKLGLLVGAFGVFLCGGFEPGE